MRKTEVNGENSNEVFKYLRLNTKELSGKKGKTDSVSQTALTVPWNFSKWLVDENGKVVKYYSPIHNPLSMRKKIVKMLK